MTIAPEENRQIVTLDMAGAHLNIFMSPVVVFMYFKPALAAMFRKLVTEKKKCIMMNGRMVITLDKAIYGFKKFGINILRALWTSFRSYLIQKKDAALSLESEKCSAS